MQVLIGSTQVPLRWNYTIHGYSVLWAYYYIIKNNTKDKIGSLQYPNREGVRYSYINDRHDYQTRFAISSSEVTTLIINNVTEGEEATYQLMLLTFGGTWRCEIRVNVTGNCSNPITC